MVRDPRVSAHYYEHAGYGPEVAASLRKAVPGYVISDDVAGAIAATDTERPQIEAIIRRGVSALIPVTPKGPKPVRARAVAPIAEAGNVHLDPVMVGLDTFLTEVSSFPNGAHDDIVDAWSQALSRMSRGQATTESPVDLGLRIERPSPHAIIDGLRRR
jgi:predicted phage terminase large subunit-like protein